MENYDWSGFIKAMNADEARGGMDSMLLADNGGDSFILQLSDKVVER